jgi:hypothetical protein
LGTTARFIRTTFAVSDPYCFEEVRFGQPSALSNAYEPLKNGLGKRRKNMKRNWIAMLVIAGGFGSAMFGQQYPPYRGDPNYNEQSGNVQYDNGQYAGDQGNGAYNENSAYNGSYQGVYAPAPPPMPRYAYQRSPMPGPGYYWVDGYWDLIGGRYCWVGGYWMLPPYAGGYWVSPRYSGGHFFLGFWGGGRRDFDRGYVRNDYRYQGRVNDYRYQGRVNDYRYQGRGQAPRESYRAPAHSGSGSQGGDNRGARYENRGQRGDRR